MTTTRTAPCQPTSNVVEDSWGHVSSSGVAPTTAKRPVPAQPAVPDDWDDSSDEEDSEVDNQRVWQTANASAPMPTVVLSSSAAVSVPQAAFKPPLRILKRPDPVLSGSSAESTAQDSLTTTAKSLQDREAQYQAARQRIFGEQQQQRIPAAPGITRTPRGPAEGGQGEASRGFVARRTVKPSQDQAKMVVTAPTGS